MVGRVTPNSSAICWTVCARRPSGPSSSYMSWAILAWRAELRTADGAGRHDRPWSAGPAPPAGAGSGPPRRSWPRPAGGGRGTGSPHHGVGGPLLQLHQVPQERVVLFTNGDGFPTLLVIAHWFYFIATIPHPLTGFPVSAIYYRDVRFSRAKPWFLPQKRNPWCSGKPDHNPVPSAEDEQGVKRPEANELSCRDWQTPLR